MTWILRIVFVQVGLISAFLLYEHKADTLLTRHPTEDKLRVQSYCKKKKCFLTPSQEWTQTDPRPKKNKKRSRRLARAALNSSHFPDRACWIFAASCAFFDVCLVNMVGHKHPKDRLGTGWQEVHDGVGRAGKPPRGEASNFVTWFESSDCGKKNRQNTNLIELDERLKLFLDDLEAGRCWQGGQQSLESLSSHSISSRFYFFFFFFISHLRCDTFVSLSANPHPLSLHLHTPSLWGKETTRRLLNHAMKAGGQRFTTHKPNTRRWRRAQRE